MITRFHVLYSHPPPKHLIFNEFAVGTNIKFAVGTNIKGVSEILVIVVCSEPVILHVDTGAGLEIKPGSGTPGC